MSLKELAKNLLPPIVIDAANYARKKTAKQINQQMLQEYLHQGKVPWSSGYGLYRENLLTQILADQALLEHFRSGQLLPADYGVGIDERCIEYPWLFSHLPTDAKCILDAGSVLNHDFILNHSIFAHKKLQILTLAPEANCFWQKGVSYVYDDLRDIPIRNDYYDAVICLSTLEHLGCDNTIFIQDESYRENRTEDFVLAMQELDRVLKPGGSLFLSVPFGIYRHFGCFQQFDRAMLTRAIEAFGSTSKVVETFYRYTAKGWQLATALDCANSEYVEWIALAWNEKRSPHPIPVEPDLAAAARAVACVQLVKG